MSEVAKSCSTCEHRIGTGEFAKCSFAGSYCSIVKSHGLGCGKNYEGWVKRRGIFKRIIAWF